MKALKAFLQPILLDNRYPALHGLRVFFMLFIISGHVEVLGAAPLIKAAQTGFEFSLDFFFVLSAFLIGGLLLRARKAGAWPTFRRYYFRRALRTVPQYYVVLSALVLFRVLFSDKPYSLAHFMHEAFYLSNYPAVPTGAPVLYVMPWSWTLSVEEHFYLVAPLLVAGLTALSSRWRAASFLAMLLVPLALRWHAPVKSLSDFIVMRSQSHLRLDAIGAGLLAAFLCHRHPETVRRIVTGRGARHLCFWGVALAFMALTAAFHVDDGPWTPAKVHFGAVAIGTIPSLLTLALLFWAVSSDDRITRWLGHPSMRALGSFGYAVYLVHIPIAWVLTRLLPLQGYAGWTMRFITTAAIAYAVAYALHIVIDKPVLALRDRLTEAQDRRDEAARLRGVPAAGIDASINGPSTAASTG
jgi:peptidoglycan/LPS O-acetylase OafA/YrhL